MIDNVLHYHTNNSIVFSKMVHRTTIILRTVPIIITYFAQCISCASHLYDRGGVWDRDNRAVGVEFLRGKNLKERETAETV